MLSDGNKKNRCLAAKSLCAQTEYKELNGGFEITIKAAIFFFKKQDMEGVLKLPVFKDMAVSRRYRHVLL